MSHINSYYSCKLTFLWLDFGRENPLADMSFAINCRLEPSDKSPTRRGTRVAQMWRKRGANVAQIGENRRF